MRNLFLLLDEWDSNKVFVKKELELLADRYNVTVITNDIAKDYPLNITFYTYRRSKNFFLYLFLGVQLLADREFWKEMRDMISEHKSIIKRSSEIVRFYLNGQLFFHYLKRKKLIVKDSDAIYYSYWFFWKCFALTKHRKNYPNIKVVCKTHGYDLYREQLKSGWHPFKKSMDQMLDRLIFISDYGMNYYINTYKCYSFDKYSLYYMGTENNSGMQLYTKKDKMVLVSCSSLVPVKRIHLIIEALALINDMPIKWIHFGDGLLRESIQQLISEKLDNKTNIECIFMGHVPNQNVLWFYQKNSVDAFITTTLSEGNPVSVMEAMSYGIPIISTNVCNMPNMIRGNGILISNDPSPREVSQVIESFFHMKDSEINHMRELSRILWEENYVSEKNNTKFVDEIFDDL